MTQLSEEQLRLRNRRKIMLNSSKQPDTGCVLWQGQISNAGYGRVLLRHHEGYNKMHSAHRASYRLFIGEIPNKKVVIQRCKNRLCVNPEHLQLLDEVPNDYWHTDPQK